MPDATHDPAECESIVYQLGLQLAAEKREVERLSVALLDMQLERDKARGELREIRAEWSENRDKVRAMEGVMRGEY